MRRGNPPPPPLKRQADEKGGTGELLFSPSARFFHSGYSQKGALAKRPRFVGGGNNGEGSRAAAICGGEGERRVSTLQGPGWKGAAAVPCEESFITATS